MAWSLPTRTCFNYTVWTNTVLRKQLRRNQVAAFFAQQARCLTGRHGVPLL